MIYYVCYEAMNSVDFNDGEGRDYGFWLCGHISFTLAVIIANIIILMKSNMHNRWTFLVQFLMYAAFILAFAVESQLIMFSQIYLLFGQTFGSGTVWLILLFTFMATTGFELILEFKYHYEKEAFHVQVALDKLTYEKQTNALKESRKLQKMNEYGISVDPMESTLKRRASTNKSESSNPE